LRRHKKGTLLLRIPVPVKANSQAYQIKMQPSPEISFSFVRPTLDNLRYGGVREASTTKTENRKKISSTPEWMSQMAALDAVTWLT
jgi:hypothetical protein